MLLASLQRVILTVGSVITVTINVQSLGLNNQSTARIHRAGLAAIAGSIALALSLLGHEIARVMGIDGNIDVAGTLGFLLSYGSLAIAWGLLFIGSLGFAWIAFRSDSRLLKTGTMLVSLGLGGTALGFGFATLAGLAGLGEVALMGDMVGAIGMLIVFTLGSLITGIALVRTEIVSRMIAWLMVIVGPSMVLGAMVAPIGLDLLLFAGPVCVVWLLIGRELLSASTKTSEPTATTA